LRTFHGHTTSFQCGDARTSPRPLIVQFDLAVAPVRRARCCRSPAQVVMAVRCKDDFGPAPGTFSQFADQSAAFAWLRYSPRYQGMLDRGGPSLIANFPGAVKANPALSAWHPFRGPLHVVTQVARGGVIPFVMRSPSRLREGSGNGAACKRRGADINV